LRRDVPLVNDRVFDEAADVCLAARTVAPDNLGASNELGMRVGEDDIGTIIRVASPSGLVVEAVGPLDPLKPKSGWVCGQPVIVIVAPVVEDARAATARVG